MVEKEAIKTGLLILLFSLIFISLGILSGGFIGTVFMVIGIFGIITGFIFVISGLRLKIRPIIVGVLLMGALFGFGVYEVAISYAMKCSECGGDGKIACSICGGQGKIYTKPEGWVTCPWCHGAGYEECLWCRGTGESWSADPTRKFGYSLIGLGFFFLFISLLVKRLIKL
jgi:energy-coupling factor transporter transmembrane protein EcfT